MSLSEIYAPIAKELKEVDTALRSSVQDASNPEVLKIAEVVLSSPGKRIRPALTLLVGKAISQIRPVIDPPANAKLTRIASAFELIHMASLVHDDVMDKATIRHNKPTINSIWGEDASVAFGDFLYSISSQMTTECRDLALHGCMSRATRDMCEGELLQVCERDNLDLTQESYLTIIKKKTAGLFASSCEAGAIVFHAPLELQKAMWECGLNLGIAFQIIDDFLDLVAEQKNLGKTPGQDVEIGKLTLPLLYLLEESSVQEKREIKRLIGQASHPAAFEELKNRLSCSRAVGRTIDDIAYYISEATRGICLLPVSPCRMSLERLASFIVERASSYAVAAPQA